MGLFWVTGDSLITLRELPDECVDLIVTSPPYLRKVGYLADDDPNKKLELGIEERPVDFIENLLELSDEWFRILRDTGSICVDLGDTFSGSGGAGGDHNPGGMKPTERKYAGTAAAKRKFPDDWPGAKSLCMIPEAYRLGLAYGRNPLDSDETGSHERWLIRNVLTLCQTHPKPGRQGDKFWPATTDIVVACKSGHRYWQEDHPNPSLERSTARGDAGRAKDWWSYRNGGVKGHPASWPTEILSPLIVSMSPPGGVVLDPFAGSGTTLMVASNMGRTAIGVDLQNEYLEMARADMVGPYLQSVTAKELGAELTAIKERVAKP